MQNDTPTSIRRIIAINLLVLAVLLALVETGFRLFDPKPYEPPGQWQAFSPYVMFTTGHNPAGTWTWQDQYRHTTIAAHDFVNNRDGYAVDVELSQSKVRPKAAGEKVVVLTGGSAMWGVGASSYKASIAGQLEKKLNAGQRHVKYKVINLAMGGWASFQEYIALVMYAPNLQPDWLIGMDGYNDGAVSCAQQQGAGNPLHYALMEAYMKAYTFGQKNPPAYRGRLENTLLTYSKAYRGITGQDPVDFRIYVDPSQHGDPNAPLAKIAGYKVGWQAIEEQVRIYTATQQRMTDLFPDVPVILSLQPITSNFADAFGNLYAFAPQTAQATQAAALLKKHLDEVGKQNEHADCNPGTWPQAKDYFFGSAALEMDKIAEENRKRGRDVQFVNDGILFPASFEERQPYLIDMMHLNDAGHERVAELYARMVLAHDFPKEFKQPVLQGPDADKELAKAQASIGK